MRVIKNTTKERRRIPSYGYGRDIVLEPGKQYPIKDSQVSFFRPYMVSGIVMETVVEPVVENVVDTVDNSNPPESGIPEGSMGEIPEEGKDTESDSSPVTEDSRGSQEGLSADEDSLVDSFTDSRETSAPITRDFLEAMKKAELEVFAAEKGINISDLTRKDDYIDRILEKV